MPSTNIPPDNPIALITYVKNLEIAYPQYEIEKISTRSIEESYEKTNEQQAQSYLSNKSIMSFAAGINPQTRQDILNSTLLAQLHANKKYPAEEDMLKWYEAYKEVISNIGWVVQSTEFSTVESSKGIFEMEKTIIEILISAMGAKAIAIINRTLGAFKRLAESDSKILSFERNSHSATKGAFLIGMADETSGAVSLKIGAFILSTSSQIKKILLFKAEKDKTTLQYSSMDCSFVPEVYNLVRTVVQSKIGKEAEKYVAKIEI